METAFCHLSTFNRPIFKKQYWYMQNLNQFEFFSKLNIIYTGNVHVLSSTKYQYLCMPLPNIDTNLIQTDKGNSSAVIKTQEAVDTERGEGTMGQ